MSFHRERIQGAGAIAAAARPPRSAPSKIVRPWRALGGTPLSVRLRAKLASAQIAPVSIGLPSAGTSPVTSPGIATTGDGNTFTSFPNHPSPSSPSPSPGSAAPTSSSTPSSSTPTIVVTAPSTTNVAPARVFVTTNAPAAQTTVAPAPSPYVSSPIDLSVLTAPTPRKVPWVAIGLGVLGLAILLRK